MKMTSFEKRFVNTKRHGKANIATLNAVAKQMPTKTLRTALEIGCGVGMVAEYLAERYGLDVTATDLDADQLRRAYAQISADAAVNFESADATNLPYPDSTFHLVVSFKVLHHIGNWPEVIRQVSRVLKPGGYFVLDDIALPGVVAAILKNLLPNYGIYSIAEIRQLAFDAGLREISFHETRSFAVKKFSLLLLKEV